jgi:hypothetical protein
MAHKKHEKKRKNSLLFAGFFRDASAFSDDSLETIFRVLFLPVLASVSHLMEKD